ncbi:MAG: ComEC/Rec2 family competence protein, partial [Bacilli bacterium]
MVKKIIKNHFKFLLFFILVVIYVVFITSNLIFKSHYQIGLIDLKGYVDSFNIDGNKVSLIVKAKEKIIVNYYIDDVNSLNKYKSYQLGDYINVVGTLERPSHNTLKNGFNYNKYLMSNKIYYVLKADKIIKIKDNNKISYKLKNSLDKKINNLKSKDYVKAFILGDKTNLDEDIKISYQENGVSHLLAISGMHITLLAGIMLKILNKIHKKDNHLVVSLLLIVYAFLTNFTPSVIRATTFFIFSRFKINKINLLLLIASLLLIYNPYYIYNVGFIFSFVISLYLLIFGKLSNKFNNYFVKLFITSLICFIAGLPILINNFHMINLLSPIL